MFSIMYLGTIYLLLWAFSHQLVCGTRSGASYENDAQSQWRIGTLQLSVGKNVILESDIRKGETEPSLKVELRADHETNDIPPVLCDRDGDSVCLKWNDRTSVTIKQLNYFCHEIRWNSTEKQEDCISYGNAYWYGGSEIIHQLWLVEKMQLNTLPYITSFQDNMGVVEPMWYNSKGLFIFVHYDVPLFINSNNHKQNSLCLISSAQYPYNSRIQQNLNYTVCQLPDPRKAREYAVQMNFIKKPINIPDTKMVEYPIWSTWVQFYSYINETVLSNYTNSIIQYGFNHSQIEIDDQWETCYGSKIIDSKRFPNMTRLAMKLKELGFRTTLWTHPFVNKDCSNYTDLDQRGFFLKNATGYNKVRWWNGIGSVYDFTKPEARKWFQQVHENLLDEYGLDGFKFDAGESNIIPMNSLLTANPNEYPKTYTTAYLKTISAFGNITETRVGYRSSQYPIYTRMHDKDSRWDEMNGLRSLITTCLLLNLQGYPFVLPDMVGGNAYTNKITEELFVRWTQASTFMPVIQFSFAPWNFKNQNYTLTRAHLPDCRPLILRGLRTTEAMKAYTILCRSARSYPNTIIDITKKFTSLHYSYSGKIIELMKNSVKTGAPVNSPIWWIDPQDTIALSIDSEYLLGEDILVAPILHKYATNRDVYLPKGTWQDGNNASNIYKGQSWITRYSADLTTLPYFIKLNSSNTRNDFSV